LQVFLQSGLRIPPRCRFGQFRQEVTIDRLNHTSRVFESRVEVNGAEDCLQRIGQYGRAMMPPRSLLAGAKDEKVPEFQVGGKTC
jgi:hypothetical protein